MGRPHRRLDRWRIPLYVDSAHPFRAFDADVRYDPTRLSALGARRDPTTRQAALAVNPQTPGRLAVAFASVEAIDGQRGPALILEFRLKSPATETAVRTDTGVYLHHASVED